MESWKAAGSGSGGDGAFPCLRSTPRGRIFHCPEFRRVVIGIQELAELMEIGAFRPETAVSAGVWQDA